ncbi:hypothetical protein cypCar_00004780, partial [Cyprinus carpio]
QPETSPQLTPTPQTYQVLAEPENYSYGRPPPVSSYENKQYFQTSIAPAQRSATEAYFQTGLKSGYSPTSTAYSQPPVQRQVAALKPPPAVTSSYTIYPTSTSVQQTPAPISTYTPSSSYNSTAATSYSGTTQIYTPQLAARESSNGVSFFVASAGLSYSSYESSVYTSTPSYFQPAQLAPPQAQPQPPLQQPQQASAAASDCNNLPNSSPTPPGATRAAAHSPAPPSTRTRKPFSIRTRSRNPKARLNSRSCTIAISARLAVLVRRNKMIFIKRIIPTYREHLEGQKHKKKEAAQKSGSQVTNGPRGVQTQLRCELCDVSCTGADAYAAHIRGSKHQKLKCTWYRTFPQVVKLHTKLGKPIPSTEPVLVSSAPAAVTMTTSKTAATSTPTPTSAAQKTPAATLSKPVTSPAKKPTTAKVVLISSRTSAPAPVKLEEAKANVVKTDTLSDDEDGDGTGALGDIQPVGHDYVEEVRNDDGKVIRFHCKLCECSFNDPNAKDMHLKGRRHRLQYKKKVNPDLPVEIKPSNRARKLLEVKLRKQKQKSVLKRQQEDEQRWYTEMRSSSARFLRQIKFLCVVQQEVRGGHVLEEDGGGAVILGGDEAQNGPAPSHGPAQHAGAAPIARAAARFARRPHTSWPTHSDLPVRGGASGSPAMVSHSEARSSNWCLIHVLEKEACALRTMTVNVTDKQSGLRLRVLKGSCVWNPG